MLRIRRLQPELIHRFIADQGSLNFTYAAVGATATTPPAEYAVDHTRTELGQGEAVYDHARRALEQWQHLDLGWVEASPADTPIRTGETVVVLAHAFGLWWLNAARIVYVVNETAGSVTRFGFAYGTLPGHVESGEERFLVEWDLGTDRVSYDIFAFSRPRYILTRIAWRQARRMQKRFARDSAAAMRRATQAS